MASNTSQGERSRRIYFIYFFALHRWAKLAEHCAMEPDYFGSFLQPRWLSIFVVHEIQLRPRCIMESANGSLRATGHISHGSRQEMESLLHCFSKTHFENQYAKAIRYSANSNNPLFWMISSTNVFVFHFFLTYQTEKKKHLISLSSIMEF